MSNTRPWLWQTAIVLLDAIALRMTTAHAMHPAVAITELARDSTPKARVDSMFRVVNLPIDSTRDLSQGLRREVAAAQRLGYTPVVTLTASWCMPCRTVDVGLQMYNEIRTAFDRIYLIRVDVDIWQRELAAGGHATKVVPVYYGVTLDGKFNDAKVVGLPADTAPEADSVNAMGSVKRLANGFRAFFVKVREEFGKGTQPKSVQSRHDRVSVLHEERWMQCDALSVSDRT